MSHPRRHNRTARGPRGTADWKMTAVELFPSYSLSEHLSRGIVTVMEEEGDELISLVAASSPVLQVFCVDKLASFCSWWWWWFLFVCLFVCFSTVEEFEIKSARYFRCTGKHRYEVFAKWNEVFRST